MTIRHDLELITYLNAAGNPEALEMQRLAESALAKLDASRTHMIFGNGEYLSTMRYVADPPPQLTITDRARAFLARDEA